MDDMQKDILMNDLYMVQGDLTDVSQSGRLAKPWLKPYYAGTGDMLQGKNLGQMYMNYAGRSMEGVGAATLTRATFLPGFNFTRNIINPKVFEIPGMIKKIIPPSSSITSLGVLNIPTLGKLGLAPHAIFGKPIAGMSYLATAPFAGRETAAKVASRISKASRSFFVGDSIATESILGHMTGMKAEKVVKIMGKNVPIIEKFQSQSAFKQLTWSWDKLKGGSGTPQKTVEKLAGKLTGLTRLSAALRIADPILAGAQIGWAVGTGFGSMVKLGYDTADVVNRQSKAMLESLRNTEFESNISSMMTQAAVTEKNRALSIMRDSQINGSYPFGNETNYL